MHFEHIQVLTNSLLTMVESNACPVKQPSECFEAELKAFLSPQVSVYLNTLQLFSQTLEFDFQALFLFR